MIKLIKNIASILLLIVIPLNLTGLTVFHHYCHVSGKDTFAVTEKKDCLEFRQIDEIDEVDDCCDFDVCTEQVTDDCESGDENEENCNDIFNHNNSGVPAYTSKPCCTDELKTLDFPLPLINPNTEISKIIFISRQVDNLSYNDLRQISLNENLDNYFKDIYQFQITSIIRSIHLNSSSKDDNNSIS